MSDLPTTAIGVTGLMPTTQTQIDVFSDQVIESVKQGETNPLQVLTVLKAFEKASGRILLEIRDNFLIEAAKYPGNTFEFNGVKIEKAEVGTKYDYSKCNDPIWNQRNQIAAEANKQLKEREDFLKAVKEPFTLVDEGTGEVVTISPPLKTSTTSLKVSIR